MHLVYMLILGMICGLLPAIFGALKEELELGMFGFITCTVSSAWLGAYGAGPTSALFIFLILKRVYVKSSEPVLADVIPLHTSNESELQ